MAAAGLPVPFILDLMRWRMYSMRGCTSESYVGVASTMADAEFARAMNSSGLPLSTSFAAKELTDIPLLTK
jgi:hypothetical protein